MRATCEHCGRVLAVWCGTDGNGALVEVPALCRCEGARWRRAECVDCGLAVEWTNRKRLPRKRCPTHLRARKRERNRRHMAERYRQDPERERARSRVRYRLDEDYREATWRRASEYRRMRRALHGLDTGRAA